MPNYYSGEDEQVEYQAERVGHEIRYHLTHHTRSVPVDKLVNVSQPRTIVHPSTSLMKNLGKYCEASKEIDQHTSWASIVNEIVSLAPELIPDLPVFSLPIIFLHNPTPPDDGGPGRRTPDLAILQRHLLPSYTKEIDRQPDDESSTISDKWCQALSCAVFTSRNQAQLQMSYEALKAGLRDHLRGVDQIANTSESSPYPPTDSRAPSVDGILRTDFTSTTTGKRKAASNTSSPDFAVKRLRTNPEISEPLATDLPQYDTERLANYALCFLSFTSGARAHCLQFLVDGHHLMLWYYDAGGIIRSEWMDWIDDLPKFAAIMVAFASLDIRGWGISNIPNLRPPPDLGTSSGPLPSTLSGYTLTMTHRSLEGISQQVKVTLQDRVFTSQSLVGRRTHVYDITTEPEISKKPLVLKMSMQTSDRTPENEFIERATDNGVAHIPEMHMWSNKDEEWQLSDGVWGKLFPDNDKQEVYENRYQRLIVFTKYEPVEGIISPTNMHNLMMQLVDRIHELRYKACILHRDISLGNLMYEKLSDGSINLILNDFDLAVMVDDNGLPTAPNSSKHRTGTLPFIAHELLNPRAVNSTTHYIRHDFESVFFVALWILVRSGRRKARPAVDHGFTEQEEVDVLRGWEYGTTAMIYTDKSSLMKDNEILLGMFDIVDVGPYEGWIQKFWDVFFEAYIAMSKSRMKTTATSPLQPVDIDLETFDGSISRESIRAKLREWEETGSGEVEGFVPYFGATDP